MNHAPPVLRTPTGPRPLTGEVTTIGSTSTDVVLEHPTVSPLHAELVRRGPNLYVADLGLSRNGTNVNGRPATGHRRLLVDGDVLGFGAVTCTVTDLGPAPPAASPVYTELPEITRREKEVLEVLCRPALAGEPFAAPTIPVQIARELSITEAAVRQHLVRLCDKFAIPQGRDRRYRLANDVLALGLIRLHAHSAP